jgi:hypothetical protein
MAIIVSELNPTGWTLTAQEICRDALEHLNEYGAGETLSPDDLHVALRGLDAVLKSLPLSGYNWPKLSADVALTWSAGTPDTVSLPLDYFNYPVVHKTVDGKPVQLAQIPHSAWIGMTDLDATGEPTHFYIDPAKTLHFWPIPTTDPGATLQYQRVIDDSSATVAPDVPQYWIGPLGWGVADEISMKFGTNAADRLEIHNRWMGKRAEALAMVPYEAISITVDD